MSTLLSQAHPGDRDPPGRVGAGNPSPRFWLAYAGGWLLLGFALALADYQDPRVIRGRQPWEPFFLEIGSVAVVGTLAVGVYRWIVFLEGRRWGPVRAAAAHLGGAAAFLALHVGLTYASRFAGYAALGLEYRTGPWLAVLAFEAPKDLVTYALVAGLAYAWRLRVREQAHLLQLERARGELAELRLARLGDQLHPHFLFNCLNSIAALVEENPRAAVSMIARVGDFLRASLREGGAVCALRDEFDLARSYVEIQKLRFEGAIDARVDVAPGLDGRPVPRLVLQPLVENAIKHTMARPERPLSLRIEAMPHGDGVRLQVANSRDGERPPSDGTGRGLALVRSRLALLYGDAASIAVDESDPAWYRVFVSLPAQPPAAPAAGEPPA
jgi:signal transduction histidine kinase